MKMLFICFLIFVHIHLNTSLTNDTWCDTWRQKHLFNSTEYHYYTFRFEFIQIDTLDDLNFDNHTCLPFNSNLTVYNSNFQVFKIFSTQMLILTNDIDYEGGVLSLFRFWLKSNKKAILFQNVKGFTYSKQIGHFDHKQIKMSNSRKSFIEINFRNTFFDFYNGDKLITEEECVNGSLSQFSEKNFFRYFQFKFKVL